MNRLLCTFNDQAVEAAFRAQCAHKRRRWDTLVVALFFVLAVTVYMTTAAEADARASALHPERAAAAAASILAAATVIAKAGGRPLGGLEPVAGATVQWLQSAVSDFPLHLDATWAHKAAYTLAHAPQLLLYRVLVAHDVLFGIFLFSSALFVWRFVWRWHAGYWPSHGALALFITSWPLLRHGRIVPLLMVFSAIQPLTFNVQLALLFLAWLCSVIAKHCAASWLHEGALYTRALGAAVHDESLMGAFGKHASTFLAGVLLPAAVVWVLESRQRHAFLRRHYRQRLLLLASQHEQRQGEGAQQQKNTGISAHMAAAAVASSSKAAAAPSSIKEQQQLPDSAAPVAMAAAHGSSSSLPIGSSEQTEVPTAVTASSTGAVSPASQPAAVPAAVPAAGAGAGGSTAEAQGIASQQPQAGSSLPGGTGVGSWVPCGNRSTLYRSPFDTILCSLKVLWNGCSSGASSGESGTSGSGGGSDQQDAADGKAFATSTRSAQAVGHVLQLVQFAVRSLREQGQLDVAHVSCSCFPGCVHVVLELRVLAGMSAEDQHKQGCRVVDAARAQLCEARQVHAEVILPMRRGRTAAVAAE